MKNYILNNGNEIPALGLGVWQVNDAAQCKDVVSFALKNGYRLIDTATVYQNEASVGEGILDSGIPREEIFVCSKLWIQDMGYQSTKDAIDRLLIRMKLDYLDMYLIHHPLGDYVGSWTAMEEAVKAGKIKNIGVANLGVKQLTELIENSNTVPAIDQIEIHPLCQQRYLREFLKEKGIALEAWSPLGSGNSTVLEDADILSMAKKYGKNAGQIILRWHIQEGVIVIPKSVHQERLISNIDVWDFELTEQEMNIIRNKDTGKNILGYDLEHPEQGEWTDFLLNLKVES